MNLFFALTRDWSQIALRTAVFCVLLVSSLGSRLAHCQTDGGNSMDASSSALVPIQFRLDPKPAAFQIRAEFEGQVIIDTEERKRTSIPMSVKADFQFRQTQNQWDRAHRVYQQASADIKLDNQNLQIQLAEDRRDVTIKLLPGEHHRPVQFFPAGGLIKQQELDLLTLPGDPLSIPQLLTSSGARVGEPWLADAQAVQAFLALETVIDHQIRLMIKEHTSSQTKVYIMGHATGEVDGAYTQMRVAGIALVDPQTNQLTAMRLNVDEHRDPSQLTPGFQGKARLEIRRNQAELPPAAEQLAAANSFKSARLLWNTDSEFELIYDPRWKIIISDPEAVVLRYAERGMVLGQCNVLQLPRRSPERPAQLDEFRREVEKLVEGANARITHHDSFQLADGCRVLRIVVVGKQEELNIAWLYYTVNHPDGRRVALIFTVEQSALKSFDAADQRLVQGVRFSPPRTSSTLSTPEAQRQPQR